jgi:hypothetical protein
MNQSPIRSKRQNRRGEEGTMPLTIKILQQLRICVAQLRRLLGDHLELVRDLGRLATCVPQVCRGRAQIALQL